MFTQTVSINAAEAEDEEQAATADVDGAGELREVYSPTVNNAFQMNDDIQPVEDVHEYLLRANPLHDLDGAPIDWYGPPRGFNEWHKVMELSSFLTQ